MGKEDVTAISENGRRRQYVILKHPKTRNLV